MCRTALFILSLLTVVSCRTKVQGTISEQFNEQKRISLFCQRSIQDSLEAFISTHGGRSFLISFSIEKEDTVLMFREQYPPFVDSPFTDPNSVKRGTVSLDSLVFQIVYHDYIKSIPFIREDLIDFDVSNNFYDDKGILYDLNLIQKEYIYHNGVLFMK